MKWISRDPLKREVDSKDHDLLDEVVERILSKVTATSDFGIELQIHDLLLKNVKYVNKERNTEHTIEGPLLNKKAVCEGIAKAMKYLMNRKGIECEMVLGKLDDEEDDDIYHAWNVVRIDGEWYHVDVTADIGVSNGKSFRYDYFNLSDEEISMDHLIIRSPVTCNVSRNGYYHRMGLVINTQKEFKRILEEKLENGESEFTFKLPSAKDPEKVTATLMRHIEEATKIVEHPFRRYEISPNSNQLVYTIRFL